MEFIYLVFTRMPGGVTVCDSGLCCCVPCLSSAIKSLCLVIHKLYCQTTPLVSDENMCVCVGLQMSENTRGMHGERPRPISSFDKMTATDSVSRTSQFSTRPGLKISNGG